MKSRKNFAKTISIATTLITLTFFAFGCGDAKTTADTPEETEKATEIVSQEETEKPEPETEVVAEEETEATEQETETEKTVLFRITISNSTGTYVRNKPNNIEFEDCFLVDYGTTFDVYSVYENEDEGCSYYEVEVDGKTEYVWEEDAEIIE
jgi:lipoprotein